LIKAEKDVEKIIETGAALKKKLDKILKDLMSSIVSNPEEEEGLAERILDFTIHSVEYVIFELGGDLEDDDDSKVMLHEALGILKDLSKVRLQNPFPKTMGFATYSAHRNGR